MVLFFGWSERGPRNSLSQVVRAGRVWLFFLRILCLTSASSQTSPFCYRVSCCSRDKILLQTFLFPGFKILVQFCSSACAFLPAHNWESASCARCVGQLQCRKRRLQFFISHSCFYQFCQLLFVFAHHGSPVLISFIHPCSRPPEDFLWPLSFSIPCCSVWSAPVHRHSSLSFQVLIFFL
jgi:hypothetical protein